ncbi:MAG: SH3 domain-containing protein [Alphaproteobacteria bacterium]|nr:SH3 domain-containing protein [Alphaproteobacteria bacterium]
MRTSVVIPAKAGIHRRASARHKSPAAISFKPPLDSYARYRSRWIPAFAGMTAFLAWGLRKVSSCVIFLSLLTLPAFAAEGIDNTSHQPLPRFATLRSGEVNMRTGPGMRYPIEWVYTRRGLPVEITAEYDIWRRVRDPEGTQGWVNKTELTGLRGAIVTGGAHDLRESRDDQSPVVAHLEAGAIGQITSCAPDWCKVKFDDVKGYLRKSDFWGAYPKESFD